MKDNDKEDDTNYLLQRATKMELQPGLGNLQKPLRVEILKPETEIICILPIEFYALRKIYVQERSKYLYRT